MRSLGMNVSASTALRMQKKLSYESRKDDTFNDCLHVLLAYMQFVFKKDTGAHLVFDCIRLNQESKKNVIQEIIVGAQASSQIEILNLLVIDTKDMTLIKKNGDKLVLYRFLVSSGDILNDEMKATLDFNFIRVDELSATGKYRGKVLRASCCNQINEKIVLMYAWVTHLSPETWSWFLQQLCNNFSVTMSEMLVSASSYASVKKAIETIGKGSRYKHCWKSIYYINEVSESIDSMSRTNAKKAANYFSKLFESVHSKEQMRSSMVLLKKKIPGIARALFLTFPVLVHLDTGDVVSNSQANALKFKSSKARMNRILDLPLPLLCQKLYYDTLIDNETKTLSNDLGQFRLKMAEELTFILPPPVVATPEKHNTSKQLNTFVKCRTKPSGYSQCKRCGIRGHYYSTCTTPGVLKGPLLDYLGYEGFEFEKLQGEWIKMSQKRGCVSENKPIVNGDRFTISSPPDPLRDMLIAGSVIEDMDELDQDILIATNAIGTAGIGVYNYNTRTSTHDPEFSAVISNNDNFQLDIGDILEDIRSIKAVEQNTKATT